MFSITPGLYPQDASSNLPTSCDNKNISTHGQMFLQEDRYKITPSWEYWFLHSFSFLFLYDRWQKHLFLFCRNLCLQFTTNLIIFREIQIILKIYIFDEELARVLLLAEGSLGKYLKVYALALDGLVFNSSCLLTNCYISDKYLFLLTFYFKQILELLKSFKNSLESSHIPFLPVSYVDILYNCSTVS